MSVSMRPIRNDDIKRMTHNIISEVKVSPQAHLNSSTGYDGTVVSSAIFGKADHDTDPLVKDKVYEDEYTRVGYIKLSSKILNPFLSGRKAPVWCRLLGLKNNDLVLGIINGEVLCDLTIESKTLEGKLVYKSDGKIGSARMDRSRFLYGADLLLALLNEVDLEKKLINELLMTYVKPCMTSDEFKDFIESIDMYSDYIVCDKPDMQDLHGWMYGPYFVVFENMGFNEKRAQELYATLEDLQSDIKSISQFDMISLLISMINGDGLEAIKSQIMDYVFVLPRGYRPTIDGRVDALTSQYNKLVNANNDLAAALSRTDASVYTVLNKYTEVVQYVRNIFIGDDKVKSMQRLKNYKSISDTITGKEGLMRGRMQGVRVDYSGRTVITCHPDMPIDTVGIPISMLMKIAEPNVIRDIKESKEYGKKVYYKNLSRFSSVNKSDVDAMSYAEFLKKWLEKEDRYGVIGRQPTLFYLGLQAFKIIPVEGDAIVLSPLIVMPFNADFDGDQMHFNMPVTKAANAEVKKYMSFSNNIRYPKNGEITIVTRHEIIYGLYMCSTIKDRDNSRTVSTSELNSIAEELGETNATSISKVIYDAVCRQKIAVYDKVQASYGQQSAGIVALQYAIYGPRAAKNIEDELCGKGIKSKQITELLLENYGNNTQAFLSAINRLVKLGFSVARIWPPNISTIVDSSIYDGVYAEVEKFNQDVLQREEYVNMGIETEEEFTNYFNSKWNELGNNKNGTIIKYLLSHLNKDNGYITMMTSGGKGDESNIMQIFGIKGRVQKNDTSSFNSIVAGSYARQLTGLEHFITAYGSRKGISDKVLATAEPGYMSRKLEHAGSIICIKSDDCGTTNGIEFTLEDIVPFLDDSKISDYGVRNESGNPEFYNTNAYIAQLQAARDYLSNIIVGRYCVDNDGSSVYIEDIKQANYFIDKHWGHRNRDTGKYEMTGDGIVKMRSPIYCDKPCCAKCYGKDIAAGKRVPTKGRAVGFIAAQAIGEPGTQMTMKNFQKGGVVSDANLTSAFALIEDYFELHDFSKRKYKQGVLGYDMISPVDGTISEQYLGNGTKRIFIKPDNPDDSVTKARMRSLTNKRIIVHAQTKLKSHVLCGDSLQKIQGNLNMAEVIKYRGFDKAVSYLTLMLYNIFITQDVNIKHFEVIVAAMSLVELCTDVDSVYDYVSLHTDEKHSYRAGSMLTWPEYKWDIKEDVRVRRIIVGLKTLPKYKNDFFESLLMENMDSYIPRAILMNPNDSMKNPITRAAFGLNIGIGSDMEGDK